MKIQIDLPERMKGMKLDERGYPIPYFAAVVNGKPDFRYMDSKKLTRCIEEKRCYICSQRLLKGQLWFIAGPMGMKNRVHSDPPMHEECARFSLKICPHMFFEKSERREGEFTPAIGQMLNKPSTLYLIRASEYRVLQFNMHRYLNFKCDYTEKYIYVDGRLTKTQQNDDISRPDVQAE